MSEVSKVEPYEETNRTFDRAVEAYMAASEALKDAWRELTKLGIYRSPPPSPRFNLPDERHSRTVKIDIMSPDHPFEGYLTAGDYTDGKPGEMFLVAEKMGSFVSGILDAFATAVSAGLQHGVPLQWYVDKFKFTRFEPAGMTKNPVAHQTSSILDFVMRWLEHKYSTKTEETDGRND